VTIDDYLDGAPEPHRSTLIELRRTLRKLLPEASEGLSYGVPAFEVGGKAVAGYAYHKSHCGYYPHSEAVLPVLADELTAYEWSRGTLRFPVDGPLPEALVARLVEVRLAELRGGP
jgi:uncharacterized protein YdhG (YjbR/CyaY superfamily)